MPAFQNEEGTPLVAEELQQDSSSPVLSIGKKAILAVVAMGVLAATAYSSFQYGVNNGMQALRAGPMKMNKETLFPFTGVHEPLPNDANGPMTNEDAIKSIKSHKFDKYEYMKDKILDGEFYSYGHGMAQDASPIPDDPDYEGGKSSEFSFFLCNCNFNIYELITSSYHV